MPFKDFHGGRGNLDPATIHQLDKMETTILAETKVKAAHSGGQRHAPELGLIQLIITEMLTINNVARPDIRKALQRLRCVTLEKELVPICEKLLVSPYSENAEFIVERQVFREWLGLLEAVGWRGQLYLPMQPPMTLARHYMT
jgi:hypothetical protein